MEDQRGEEIDQRLAADDNWPRVGRRQADAQGVAGIVRRATNDLLNVQIGQAAALRGSVIFGSLRAVTGDQHQIAEDLGLAAAGLDASAVAQTDLAGGGEEFGAAEANARLSSDGGQQALAEFAKRGQAVLVSLR